MALGLLFWISWICFLLLNSSAGLPAIKGYGYPHVPDSRNMGDDGDDVSDVRYDSEWQPQNNPASSHVHTSYPSLQAPGLGSMPQAPNTPEIVRPVPGGPIGGGHYQPNEPLLFPLRPSKHSEKPTEPQQNPVQPQLEYGSDTSGIGEPAWQPQATPPAQLVFENVFKYPEEETEGAFYPSAPTAMAEPSPVYSSYPESVFEADNAEFSPTSYEPQVETPAQVPAKAAAHKTQTAEITQRVSEPFPSSYIIQSRGGYRRVMYRQNGLRYAPEIPHPMAQSAKGVRGPAPQPAAPVSIKKPQRGKW